MRINYRNHRKVVLVDGKVAWTGGLNVGTEYLGEDKRYGPRWRDTHLRLEGPAALPSRPAWLVPAILGVVVVLGALLAFFATR